MIPVGVRSRSTIAALALHACAGSAASAQQRKVTRGGCAAAPQLDCAFAAHGGSVT